MSTVAIPYRVFELPWTPSEAEERRYRRVLGAALGLFIAFGVVIPLLPDKPRSPARRARRAGAHRRIHPRAAEAEAACPRSKCRRRRSRNPCRRSSALSNASPGRKDRAETGSPQEGGGFGLLALSDQLAELRDLEVTKDVAARPLNAGAGEKTRVDRSILTAKVGTGSGGIAVSQAEQRFRWRIDGPERQHDRQGRLAGDGRRRRRPEAERSGQSAKAARYA